ncbi:uncharacterized protein BT62DRAFT_903959, partial [Guyanagaster necrorhizus]
WVTELLKYQYMLHHKARTANRKADLLSRQIDHNQRGEDNDGVVVMIFSSFFPYSPYLCLVIKAQDRGKGVATITRRPINKDQKHTIALLCTVTMLKDNGHHGHRHT